MLQLCYASVRKESQNDLLQDLSDILAVARKFNKEQNIVGALYYAEGYFFQCLEGDADKVNQLYSSIAQDLRHYNVHRFPDREVSVAGFGEWSMKYVHKHGDIASLFSSLGYSKFMPHELNSDTMQPFLQLLYNAEENQENLASPQGYKQRGYVPYF